jgi:DHA2 family multidrug resistance protein
LFGSGEILIEATVAASAFYLFLAHTFTADEPFVRPALFRDRNFVAGMIFIFVVGVTYLGSLAILTPYLQDLLNYPIVTAGLLLGPRGIGTMAVMMIMGRLVGKVDTRLLFAIGLGIMAWTFYEMTGWTPDVSEMTIIRNGVIQGAGLGFLFVPLSAVALATLPPEHRTEGAGLFNLSRNIGSSIGVSVVTALLTQNTQINHAEIVQHVTAVNRVFENSAIAQFWNPATPGGRAVLDAMVTQQAQIIAYIDDFKLLMIATLAVIPLLIVFKQASGGGEKHTVVA